MALVARSIVVEAVSRFDSSYLSRSWFTYGEVCDLSAGSSVTIGGSWEGGLVVVGMFKGLRWYFLWGGARCCTFNDLWDESTIGNREVEGFLDKCDVGKGSVFWRIKELSLVELSKRKDICKGIPEYHLENRTPEKI